VLAADLDDHQRAKRKLERSLAIAHAAPALFEASRGSARCAGSRTATPLLREALLIASNPDSVSAGATNGRDE
jgi:hypothetical protein